MAPHSGSGGCAPTPRKDSAARSRMARLTSMVALTSTGDRQFGSRWNSRMRHCRWPSARAVRMNSFSRCTRTWPRMSRAYCAHQVMTRAIAQLTIPRPITVAKASAQMICGNARKNSVTRISHSSARRPEAPITSPARPPTAAATATSRTEAARVGRAPWTTRAQRSRPFSSVPKGWARLGGCSRARKSMALGSRRVNALGTAIMAARTSRTAPEPTAKWPPRRTRGRRMGAGGAPRRGGAARRRSALSGHVPVAVGDAVALVDEALDVLPGDDLVDDAPVDHHRGVLPEELRGLAQLTLLAGRVEGHHRVVDEPVVVGVRVVGEVAAALRGIRVGVVHGKQEVVGRRDEHRPEVAEHVHRGAGVARRAPVGGALDQRRPGVVEELEPDVELGQLRLEDLEDRPLVGVALLRLVPELESPVRVARLGEELLGPRWIVRIGVRHLPVPSEQRRVERTGVGRVAGDGVERLLVPEVVQGLADADVLR